PTDQYLMSIVDHAGRITRYTYDTNGAPVTASALLSVEDTDGTIDVFTYDSRGRLVDTHKEDAAMPLMAMMPVTYTYGPGPGQVSATDAAGGTATYSFDHLGLLIKIRDALGYSRHFTYDDQFNVSKVIDAAGQVYGKSGVMFSRPEEAGLPCPES